MSLILEALRKSEAERRRAQAPDLFAEPQLALPRPHRTGSRWAKPALAGAGLIVLLENVFPPIPSEVILPLAGFAASQGSFSIAAAIFWTTVGSILGAFVLYGLGRWLGHDRTVRLAARLPFVDPDDITRTVAALGHRLSVTVRFRDLQVRPRHTTLVRVGTPRRTSDVIAERTSASRATVEVSDRGDTAFECRGLRRSGAADPHRGLGADGRGGG